MRDAVGDLLNGPLFDLLGGRRALFLHMASYTALAFVTVLFVRGAYLRYLPTPPVINYGD